MHLNILLLSFPEYRFLLTDFHKFLRTGRGWTQVKCCPSVPPPDTCVRRWFAGTVKLSVRKSRSSPAATMQAAGWIKQRIIYCKHFVPHLTENRKEVQNEMNSQKLCQEYRCVICTRSDGINELTAGMWLAAVQVNLAFQFVHVPL